MLALGLVRDVALLGILEGRGHVAGRGHLLLHAGDLALAWFFSQKRRADEEVFRRATCAVPWRCGHWAVGVLSQIRLWVKRRHGGPLDRQEDEIFCSKTEFCS